MNDEFRFHIDMETESNVRTGMSRDEARRQALAAFGNVHTITKRAREIHGSPMLGDMWGDLRYGLRRMRKDLPFTLVVTLTLAIGIGGLAASLTLVNSFYLRPLPYPGGDKLVMVWDADLNTGDWQRPRVSDFVEWTQSASSVTDIAAFVESYTTISGDGIPERVDATWITPGFFAVLGSPPQLGRGFLERGDSDDGEWETILSHGLWQRRFGGDPDILGKSVAIGDMSFTVVGVLPENFAQFQVGARKTTPDLWLQYVWESLGHGHDALRANVVARMSDNTNVERLESELSTIANHQGEDLAERPEEKAIQVVSLRTQHFENARPVALVLLGVSVLILLTVSVNAANLFLARGHTRAEEFSLRLAIGACRWRLVRLLFLEGCLYAAAGGGLGLLLVAVVSEFLHAAQPAFMPSFADVSVDAKLVVLTLLVSVAVVVLCSILPLSSILSRGFLERSSSTMRSATNKRPVRRPREFLVAAEIGLTATLLFGAVVLCKSLLGLMSIDPGFNTRSMLAFEIEIHRTLAPDPKDASRFFADIKAGIDALPGVVGMSAVGDLPFGDWNPQWRILPEGSTLGMDNPPRVEYRTIDSDYFDLMGIPVLSGRTFGHTDDSESPIVVVLSQRLADWFWPGQVAVGKRVDLSPGDAPEYATVIGIVADDLDDGLRSAPEPRVYMAYAQLPKRHGAAIVKTSVEPYSVVPSIRQAVAEAHDRVAVANVTTLDEMVNASIDAPRAATFIAGGFGLLALLLAAVGIHGVMACDVRSRLRDIGVRTALGANPTRAARDVLNRALLITLFGAAAGIALAAALGKILKAFLHEVSPLDPASLLLTIVLVVSIATLSAAVPARHASRVDPMIALRAE